MVGGIPENSFSNVELIDLSGSSTSCPGISDHPEALYGAVGTFINDQPLVCGGYNIGSYINNCYGYDMQVLVLIC